jgi:peptide-methionine (R)-S-oxide reductase
MLRYGTAIGILGLLVLGGWTLHRRAARLRWMAAEAAEPVREASVRPPEWREDGSMKTIERSEREWRERLGEQEYRVLREHGTEPPFTGKLLKVKEPGRFVCAGCNLPLFRTAAKFESGTGWPSFHSPLAKEHVGTRTDSSLGMTRTEVHCARCGGHLGHVFEDGPEPTGLRYCINSVALDFVSDDQETDAAADAKAKSPLEREPDE